MFYERENTPRFRQFQSRYEFFEALTYPIDPPWLTETPKQTTFSARDQ